ncbi:MAG: acyl-ACP thioesterase domain-containing protein [Bacteroidota bacterium]
MQKLPHLLTYRESFKIRTYETGQKKEATLAHLLKLMHEAAMQNVIDLKVSVWDLEKAQISWVIRQMRFRVQRLPQLGETITIETHPAGFHRLFTYRDYRVFDADGQLIAEAASKWLLMDTQNRRLAPIPADFIVRFKMPDPADCLPRPELKLPPWQSAERQRTFRVAWYDLDFNGHLNNVVYLNWMLEALAAPVLQNGQLQQLDIIYRAEAQWQDEVRAEVQTLDTHRFLHRLVRTNDQKELATALTDWTPNQ